MKRPIHALLAVVLCTVMTSTHLGAQERGASSDSGAFPLLGPGICGKGTLLFALGEQSVGGETFEIKCRPDGGYSASGHSELKVPGAAMDLNSTLDTDKTGSPTSSTAKGTVAGSPFDQSVTVTGDTASLTTNGNTRALPFKEGMVFLGANIFYMFQFAAARYDAAKGGAQDIAVFPNFAIKIERIGRDRLNPKGSQDSKSFDRYSVKAGPTLIVVWFDNRGRLSAVAVPTQNFGALRDEYSSYGDSFKGALASDVKGATPDYSAPAGATYTAEEVSVQAKGFTLAGTLLLPKGAAGPVPAVITITGSGQQTRDERLALSGLEKYRPFGQIAEALASRGIAVLRVDDRGVGKSTGVQTLETATSADFADDVRAQIDYLRSRREIDPARIALVGHSEGGVIAPMVAATDPKVAAIVLMAGTAKRGDDVLAYQINYELDDDKALAPEAKEKQRAEQLANIKKVVDGGDTSGVPQMMRSSWMKYFFTYDPQPTIRKVRQPILILQGEIDRQVTADQAPMLEKAAREGGNRDVTVKVFSGLNHLFLPAKTGSPAEYSRLSTNTIGDDVIKALSDWLEQKLKPAK